MNLPHLHSRSALVIGAGVIGTASAYYLRKAGWHVTLIDRGRVGGGCSHANCGFVCPSHVLPLAEPGAVRAALGALLKKDSPLYIKPRLDLELGSWLVHFARRSNHRAMMAAGRACQALLNSSCTLYQQLIAQEQIDCEWEQHGLLLVYQSRQAMEAYAATDRLLTESFAVPSRRLSGEELTEFEPALKPGLAGGYYYAGDAHLRPDRLLAGWRDVLLREGVRIWEDCAFHGFIRRGDVVCAARTTHGSLSADAFVVATGAWTALLQKPLKCRVPIQPGKGYSITMPRPDLCPRRPLIFLEHRVAVTPMQSGYRLGSTMELSGFDDSLNRRRLALLTRGAEQYLLQPYCEPVQEEWFGWRPMTYDGLPIIGFAPRAVGVVIAAGHNMLGLSMAPATGKLVSELLSGQRPHIDPAPYSPARFAR